MRDRHHVGSSCDRRSLLRLGAGLAATAGLSLVLPAAAHAAPSARALSFHHLHTGETLTTDYWVDGRPVPGALAEIDRLLRDFRTSEVRPIDVRLLDLLHRVQTRLGTNEPFHIISGYRSPTTNAKLAIHGSGVARRSLHVEGQAIDVRVPGRSLRDLHGAAVAQKAGGVGMYPRSDFVHLDVGRVRYW
jgi:uncharacterized protein YcbK (DUF882 family)